MANIEVSRAQRLDQKVVELVPSLSRAFAAKLVEQGRVTVNSKPETKPGYKLRTNDTVETDYRLEAETQLPEIELEVLYEDDDCVVINKPVGLLVHSKGVFNPEATVASWLRSQVKGVEGNRAGIVHRLDRATSGVMICAKTPEALSWLQKQFAQRKTKKRITQSSKASRSWQKLSSICQSSEIPRHRQLSVWERKASPQKQFTEQLLCRPTPRIVWSNFSPRQGVLTSFVFTLRILAILS